jgi:Putative zinc-finger
MIMKCNECKDDLTAYLDGELSVARADAIRSHLDLCEPCAAEHREMESALKFTRLHTPPLSLRPEVWDGIHDGIATFRPSPRPANALFAALLSRWRAAAAIAAIAAIIAVGFWSYLRYQSSEEEFRQYMNTYLSLRDEQERLYHTSAAAIQSSLSEVEAIHPEDIDNPFVEPESSSFDNPFRSEDQ